MVCRFRREGPRVPPRVAYDRCPARRRLEQPPRWAPAHGGHRHAGDVERDPARGEEGRVSRGRQVADEI